MGSPAARASVDKAAHSGPIQSGSPDVIIGGFPAARKGDSFSCTQHGSGIIVGGSGSVLVNGVSLARQGDKTQCNTGGTPASSKPKSAPPQYWGGSLAKKAGEDGTIHGDHYDGRILSIWNNEEDKTEDGSYDTASMGVALEDLTLGNMQSQDVLKGEVRSKLAVANVNSTDYGYSTDLSGFNTGVTATGAQYGATGAVGNQGAFYLGATGDVTLATAEAKAISELYTGDKGRYGFSGEVGAEAAAVKGEVKGNLNFYNVVVAEGKIGGSAAAIGGSAGLGIYVDTKDYSINIKISGKMSAVILGAEVDTDLKIAAKPVLDIIWDEDDENETGENSGGKDGDGAILTGCNTVLVGD